MDKNILRATYKLSSALNDFDLLGGIPDKKYFTGGFENQYSKFFNFFIHHMKYHTTNMYAKSPLAWNLLVYEIPQSIGIDAENEEAALIGSMVSKMTSALQDLKLSPKGPENNIITKPLIDRLSPIIMKSYVKKVPNTREGINLLTQKYSEIYKSALL
jgi:hypothetical protein